ncbi:UNVERIFIED_CONTAM: hypothetical protein GTU68_003859 [Idotea baltica]|nr:hypothetical protein [Idotea baltica]
MTDNNNERRQFSRIPFDAHAVIKSDRNEPGFECIVIDVSLKGLLVDKPADWHGSLGLTYNIDLILADAQFVISMTSTVAHIDTAQIGFECQQFDLDGLAHLKRLVSFNLGDDSLLEREFSTLINR